MPLKLVMGSPQVDSAGRAVVGVVRRPVCSCKGIRARRSGSVFGVAHYVHSLTEAFESHLSSIGRHSRTILDLPSALDDSSKKGLYHDGVLFDSPLFPLVEPPAKVASTIAQARQTAPPLPLSRVAQRIGSGANSEGTDERTVSLPKFRSRPTKY